MARKPNAPVQAQFQTLSDARRVVLLHDSVLVELRDSIGGGYRPEHQLFWDEIRSIYVWYAPDARTITLGIIFGVVIGLISLAALSDSGMSPVLLIWEAVALATVGFFVVLGMKIRPRRWIRIDSPKGEILFSTHHKT